MLTDMFEIHKTLFHIQFWHLNAVATKNAFISLYKYRISTNHSIIVFMLIKIRRLSGHFFSIVRHVSGMHIWLMKPWTSSYWRFLRADLKQSGIDQVYLYDICSHLHKLVFFATACTCKLITIVKFSTVT